VQDAEVVDAVIKDAVEAGATVTREAVEKPFGYSGVFADPDGHTWEVAWVRGWKLHDDGSVRLGSIP
jgi:predicted lactoylglutathione lyase